MSEAGRTMAKSYWSAPQNTSWSLDSLIAFPQSHPKISNKRTTLISFPDIIKICRVHPLTGLFSEEVFEPLFETVADY